MKKYIIIASCMLLMAFSILHLFGKLRQARRETDRWRDNAIALSDDMAMFIIRNGRMAAETGRQRLTISEMEETNAQLAQTIEALRIKLRHTESVTQIAQRAQISFVPDTVRTVDTVFIDRHAPPRPHLRYADEWVTFESDSAVRISTRDTLTIVRHGRVRRFLWWTWTSHRNGRITVTNANPYVHVADVRTIDLE